MSWDKARDVVKMLDNTVQGLEAIQGLTQAGGPVAGDALLMIGAILSALLDGFAAKTTPDVVQAELQALVERIAANDATADQALHEKFGDKS